MDDHEEAESLAHLGGDPGLGDRRQSGGRRRCSYGEPLMAALVATTAVGAVLAWRQGYWSLLRFGYLGV